MRFIKKRKEKLFEECIILNQEKFYRLAFIYVKNPQDAMDILQDSILKAYSKISNLKDENALEKWINRIIVNTALDFIRKNSKVILVNEDKEIYSLESNVKDEYLGQAIDLLEPELKSIIILKYFHGYTINELADILEVPIYKVKNRLHKALNILRVEVREEF